MEIQSGSVSPIENIKEGWEIIKEDYWIFFAICLVFIAIVVAVSFGFSIINNLITLGVTAALGGLSKSNEAATAVQIVPTLISLVISVFTNFGVSVITTMLMCGIMNSLSKKTITGVFNFGDMFSGLQQFTPCVVVSLILTLIQFVLGLGMLLIAVVFGVSLGINGMMKDGKFDPAIFSGLIGVFFVVAILAIIVSLLIAVCTTFIYPLLGERNLSGLEAVSMSVRGGLSNAAGLIGLLILQGLMILGGALLCLVGMLFVIPIIYASTFAAYRSVFGSPQLNTAFNQPPPPPTFNNQPSY
jgi:hypothetical protein